MRPEWKVVVDDHLPRDPVQPQLDHVLATRVVHGLTWNQIHLKICFSVWNIVKRNFNLPILIQSNSVIKITVITILRMKWTIFGPKLSALYYLNLHVYNNVTVMMNKYWQSSRVRNNRVWLPVVQLKNTFFVWFRLTCFILWINDRCDETLPETFFILKAKTRKIIINFQKLISFYYFIIHYYPSKANPKVQQVLLMILGIIFQMILNANSKSLITL